MQGRLPRVDANVRLHKGWFEESLPGFLARYNEPIRFLNIDCDLYSSTKSVFQHLGSRIGKGTVIVFDEYFCTARWREDEYKAFQEAVQEQGWCYDYLAFNPFSKQASVIIT